MKVRGFMLIELIVSIGILIVVIAGIYNTFYIGIKIWKREGRSVNIQRIRIGLLRLQNELRSSFFFSKLPFKGNISEMTFPIIIQKDRKPYVFIITYKIERTPSGMSRLLKIMRPFKMDDAEVLEKEETKGVFSADLIQFAYGYANKDKSLEWLEAWDEPQDNLPVGIRVSFMPDKSESLSYNKVIFIPHGRLGIR